VLCVVALFAYSSERRGWLLVGEISACAAIGLGFVGGIRALGRTGRWNGLGCLMAAAGLVVGIFVIQLPPPSHVSEFARQATCKSNLRQIGLACHMYADDHGEEFPPGFQDLVPAYVDNPKVYKCPSGDADWQDFRTGKVSEASSSCTYVPSLCARMPGSFILAYDKSTETHHREGHSAGRNVLFADAHVEWWSASREAEFQEKLKKQREAVRKWREAGAKKEDIPKFFGKLEASE
jgi:prepilin-type processing-associated H-X9-DG protein